MILKLLDTWGRQVVAEVVIEASTVTVLCRDAIVGIANREYLHAWLRNPDGMYTYDAMTWMATGAGGGVALAIDDMVPAWPLDDAVVNNLKAVV